jgi:hypothetical protein
LLRSGGNLTAIVNPEISTTMGPDKKFYDIISWDPRGVNNTSPHLDCYPDAYSMDVFELQWKADGLFSASFANNYARSKALGSSCSQGGEISKQ